MQKLLISILLLTAIKSSAQKRKELIYEAGRHDSLPNIQLYLKKDSTYELKLFRKSCWAWEFLRGRYYYENDSLVLAYEKFYPEPLCLIVDTFYKQRNLKLLYIHEKRRAAAKLTINLNHNTSTVDHFPLSYADTTLIRQYGSNITHTYYAPYFTTKTKKVKFYKPERRLDKVFLIKLKIDNNSLIPGNNVHILFDPFESLIQQ